MVIKPPAEFKAGSKWKPFKEGANAYFNCIKGIIRDQEVPNLNQAYQSKHHCLIAITPLQGIKFEDDNGKVFDALKSWTLNGSVWTWMHAWNNTRNGRNAWLALVSHFEGDTQRDHAKDG
jgi:hypothetical protein